MGLFLLYHHFSAKCSNEKESATFFFLYKGKGISFLSGYTAVDKSGLQLQVHKSLFLYYLLLVVVFFISTTVDLLLPTLDISFLNSMFSKAKKDFVVTVFKQFST